MQGLRFREANIMKVIERSLLSLPCRDRIAVELTSSLDDETILIDHNQMVSVLIDLERNAVESMPGSGTLTIAVTGDERQITVSLIDTGGGIAEENIPLLFTPFFTTKPVGDGTGLGLPLAYATVKAHRGTIAIESNADSNKGPTGTNITITLPRRQVFRGKRARLIVHEA